MAPGRMAPPETVMRPQPGGVEGRTVMASPLADRLGGPLQMMQQMQQEQRQLGMMTQMLSVMARNTADQDPKRAADFYRVIADIQKRLMRPSPGPPTSPAGVQGMAGRLPMSGAPGQGGPPPAAGGAPLSGLRPGL